MTNCGKLFALWEFQTILSIAWETCMWVKKQQLEPGVEQLTGLWSSTAYDGAGCCHPVAHRPMPTLRPINHHGAQLLLTSSFLQFHGCLTGHYLSSCSCCQSPLTCQSLVLKTLWTKVIFLLQPDGIPKARIWDPKDSGYQLYLN